MKNFLNLSFLFVLIFTSCKKEKIEIPESETPIFRADGNIDGESFSIVAGDDGAYMNTFSRKEEGIDVFSGRLSNEDFSIQLEIYDGNIDLSNASFITSMPKNLQFVRNNNQPLLVLRKNAFQNASIIESVDWRINDDSVTFANEYSIFKPGKYKICADFRFFDGSQTSISENLTLGYKHHAHGEIDLKMNQQGVLKGGLTTVGSEIESIRWYKNGSMFSHQPCWTTNLSQEFQNLEAQVQFENGVQKVMRTIYDGMNHQRNIESLSIFEKMIQQEVERDFDVRLKVKKNGTEFTSDFANNSNSKVQINKIDYYGKNNKGKDTFKIQAEIQAFIQENENSSPKLISFSTTFGLQIQ